jgi:hypothetical protein
MYLRSSLLVLAMLARMACFVFGAERADDAKKTLEALSPDGQFAFRYTVNPEDESDKRYELIERKSGKVLAQVAESDPEFGPSARFNMSVLWRPDSKAFALTATLWKRASEVAIFRRDGASFREVKLPEFEVEIPAKVKAGKEYPHVVALSSQSAKRWQKNGSLVIEITTIQDGAGGTVTGTQTVVLGFDRSGEARILKSSVKYATDCR